MPALRQELPGLLGAMSSRGRYAPKADVSRQSAKSGVTVAIAAVMQVVSREPRQPLLIIMVITQPE